MSLNVNLATRPLEGPFADAAPGDAFTAPCSPDTHWGTFTARAVLGLKSGTLKARYLSG